MAAVNLWVPTNEMADVLGIHEKTLRRMKTQGMFKEGHHYRKKNPLAPRGKFLWHTQRVEMHLGLI